MENRENNFHPQLKKIKRPINRMAPQVNQQPNAVRRQENFSPLPENNISKEIDRYLDEPTLTIQNTQPPYNEAKQDSVPEFLDEAI